MLSAATKKIKLEIFCSRTMSAVETTATKNKIPVNRKRKEFDLVIKQKM